MQPLRHDAANIGCFHLHPSGAAIFRSNQQILISKTIIFNLKDKQVTLSCQKVVVCVLLALVRAGRISGRS